MGSSKKKGTKLRGTDDIPITLDEMPVVSLQINERIDERVAVVRAEFTETVSALRAEIERLRREIRKGT